MKRILTVMVMVLPLLVSCDFVTDMINLGNEESGVGSIEELKDICFNVPEEDLNGWEEGYTDGNNYIAGSSISDSDSTIFMMSSSNKPDSYIYILFDHTNSLIGFGTEENWISAQEGKENVYLNWFDDEGNICGDYYKIGSGSREMSVTRAKSDEELFDYGKLSKIAGVIDYAENAVNIYNHKVEQEWGLLVKDIASLSASGILDMLKASPKLNIGLFLGGKWLDGFESTHYQRNRIAMYNECSSEITEISADGKGNINVFVTVKNANTVPTVLPRNYYPIEEDITNTVYVGIVGREEVHPTSVIYTEPYKSESLLDRTWGDIYYLMYTFPKPTNDRGYVFRSYLKSTRFTNDNGEVSNGYIKYSDNYYFRDLGFIDEFDQESFTESDGEYTFKCTAHASINSLEDVVHWGIYYADARLLEQSLFFPKGYSEPSVSSPNEAEFDLEIKIPIENFKENKTKDVRFGLFCYNSSDNITLYGTPQTFQLTTDDRWVDLGLPSGILWAAYNVGATSPEEYGDYFSWGTFGKWCDIDPDDIYNHNRGNDISGSEYDVANVKWGDGARIPTVTEMDELWENCTFTLACHNNTKGNKVTGPNGNSIFLPFAGSYEDAEEGQGLCADFWSSSLTGEDLDHAYYMHIGSSYNDTWDENWVYIDEALRELSFTIRPVKGK